RKLSTADFESCVQSPSTFLRKVGDPTTLRALAHPVRLRIYEELAVAGPATATELAERLGESPANCSWHLRQLARHGFIEEAGGGTGRQRPWRIVPRSTSIAEADEVVEQAAIARDALIELIMGRELEAWRAWHHARSTEPAEWQKASIETVSVAIWLTAEELAAFKQELDELVQRRITPHLDRIDPARRPAGSRPVRVVAWAIPGGPSQGGGGAARDRGPDQGLPPEDPG